MVTFNCECCGDAVKKPMIKKHMQQCGSNAYSCVDCSVTFQGEAVHGHTSCMTEAEKYQGNLYRGPKKNPTSAPSPAPAAAPAAVAEEPAESKKRKQPEETSAHEFEDLSAVVRSVFAKHSNQASMKRVWADVLAAVQRQHSLKSLSDEKRNAVTANMLTTLLDLPLTLKLGK